MLPPRVIPVLLLADTGLWKTVRFGRPVYVGDPINAAKIFNDKGVDELVLLDITQPRRPAPLALRVIQDVAEECFMPLCYGGGVRSIADMHTLFTLGIEKVAMNTAAVESPQLVAEAAAEFGSQSIVVSIDVKRTPKGVATVHTHAGATDTGLDPVAHATSMEQLGAGELMVTSIDREGTRSGLDLDLIRDVSNAVSVPTIAHGGAGTPEHLGEALDAGAAAVAAGSAFVLHGPHRAVLITYTRNEELPRAAASG